jgi:hypothetical protein
MLVETYSHQRADSADVGFDIHSSPAPTIINCKANFLFLQLGTGPRAELQTFSYSTLRN